MTPFWTKSFKGKEALQMHSLNHNFNLEIGRQQRHYLWSSKGHHCHLMAQKAGILPLHGFQCSGPTPFHDAFRLQWDLNRFKVLRLQSHCSCSCYPFNSPCFSVPLFCILNSELGVSKESTRAVMQQPLAVFYQGMYHPQPTHISPPPATKNSPGEKCYYKKGWLLCDSHCFIKKIFSPKQISVKKSKGFLKPQQNRTAHNSIFHRSATSLEIHTQTQKMFIFT